MRSTTGIIAAEDGYTINDTPLAYNSSNSHLIIDSREESRHLGIVDMYCGSQIWTLDSGVASYYEEVFYEIKHNLPFIPKVMLYALIRDTPAALSGLIGYYTGGYLNSVGGGFAIIREAIYARVGKTSIKFIRVASSDGTLTDPAYRFTVQSEFHKVRLRYKYMILSNEESDEEYDILPTNL